MLLSYTVLSTSLEVDKQAASEKKQLEGGLRTSDTIECMKNSRGKTGMHQGEGQVGQLPHPILADQKAPPGSGGAPHYYLPPRIFDPWCIPVINTMMSLEIKIIFIIIFLKKPVTK